MNMISIRRLADSVSWTWLGTGPYDSKFQSYSVVRRQQTMTSKSPHRDHVCAVGSTKFREGIFIWEIAVDHVEEMWLGISRGAEETESLNSLNT